MSTTTVDPARFGLPTVNSKKRIFGWLAIGSFVLMFIFPPFIFAGIVCGIIYLALPSAGALAAKELAARKRQWAQMAAKITKDSSEADFRSVLDNLGGLALEPDDIGEPYHVYAATLDLMEFERECDGKLRPIPGHEQIVSDEPCYLVDAVLYDKRGPNDETGKLYLTANRALFYGSTLQATPWAKVIDVKRDKTTLLIQPNDRQTPLAFVCSSLSAALKAEWISKNIVASGRSASLKERV